MNSLIDLMKYLSSMPFVSIRRVIIEHLYKIVEGTLNLDIKNFINSNPGNII